MSLEAPSIADEISQLRFASGWSDDVLQELAAISQVVTFPAGQFIFMEGAENYSVYLLCDGRVGLDMHIPAKGSVRILTLSRGELLAWSALIGDCHMTASAVALESTRAIAIDGSQLQVLCDRRPEIGYPVMRRLAWELSHRLLATRLQLLDLYAPSTPQVVRPALGEH